MWAGVSSVLSYEWGSLFSIVSTLLYRSLNNSSSHMNLSICNGIFFSHLLFSSHPCSVSQSSLMLFFSSLKQGSFSPSIPDNMWPWCYAWNYGWCVRDGVSLHLSSGMLLQTHWSITAMASSCEITSCGVCFVWCCCYGHITLSRPREIVVSGGIS